MTPDSPKTPREELEARLTALLLGELSAEEAAALRHTIGQDAELARLENQLKETIGLVRQAAASKDEKTIEPAAALQLSAERREKLLASFKTTRLEIPKKPRRTLRLNRELLKLAAMIVALLLVSGVVVSYFAPKAKSRAQRLDRGMTLRLWSGDDSSPARVTTINGSGPGVLSFESSDSRRAPLYGAPPASGTKAGKSAGALGAEKAAEAGLERAEAQILAQISSRNAQTPPPPSASPAPAKALPQLAQNADRFRTTIALPTSSEAQAADTSFGVSGVAVIGGSGKLQVEVLGEETSVRGRTGLAGGQGGFGGAGGFGGFASGGGGLGGGRGPVATSEGMDAVLIPDAGLPTASAMAFVNQTPGKSQQFGEVADGLGILNVGMVPATPPPLGGLVDTKTSGLAGANAYWDTGSKAAWAAVADPNRGAGAMGDQSFGWATKESRANKPTTPTPEQNADWFGPKDVNGPAPAIAQNPTPQRFFRVRGDVGGPAPGIDPEPVPPLVAATGLPVASPSAGAAKSSVVLGDSGVEVVRRRVDLPVNPTQPVPSPAKQTPPGSYEFALTSDDVGGLRFLSKQGQEAAALIDAATGLPVTSSAPNQKPDAAKNPWSILLKQPEANVVLVVPPPPTTTPSPSSPAATPVPALEVREKNIVATQPLSVIDNLAQKNEQDTPIPLATNGTFSAITVNNITVGSTVNDGLGIDPGLLSAGTHVAGIITDPTHGTGDGREWGIRQKLDADGDSAARLYRLKDLTQSQSKRKAPAEVQDKLAKVDRGDAAGVHSVNEVGYLTQALIEQIVPSKSPPVADEERKKESEALMSQSTVGQRINGSAGDVSVNYSTTEGAAKPPGQVVVGGSLATSDDWKQASEEAVYRKSHVKIALPTGGETAQGVEREPRVQVGPVVINEIQFRPLAQEKPADAGRLGQAGGLTAGGTAEAGRSNENVSGKVESLHKTDVVPVQEFIDVVIPLKTAPAVDVARMLNSRAATGELPVAGRAKMIADERTNSLLIFGSREDLNSISNAIRRFDAPIPQGEVETAENFFSTFSLNVSDVSFKLAAASLEKGQMPDPATVRSEEFINAFDYRDPEPGGSAPIAFAWERARYPFAHNRDLLRFSIKTAASGRQPGRPLNLVLLLDNSGSMERADRVRVIRECLRVLAGQLQPQDRVSVVAFARTARLWVDGLTGAQAGELVARVGQLSPQGGTNLEDAMNVAYQTALRHFLPNGVNRVVLLTDGAANLGDVEPESLKKKVEAHRKQGVALDCFGIGWDGYNDDLLEVLSRNGDGRYGFVNTPEAAASEFAGQLAGALRVAASDVKVQVQFNPRRVTAWRQIGYAKHQLTKEQFRDNTVDAAEIGAAEQGNALYTVQVNPNGEGPLGVVRVRFKVPGTSDYREHEWAVPYSGAATPLEQSSPALRLAATASAFSEWLVSSPFAAEVTPDRLLGYLSGVPETCAADPRPKKLEWMIRQAKSLAGK